MPRAAAKRRSGATTQADAIIAAARRHGVPIWLLVAVKLLETGAGSGSGAVSSVGAQGSFQFMPSTAAAYGVKIGDFGSEADGAARLLAEYRRKYGSWNAALEGYNGGPGAIGKGYAYTERDAIAKLREFGLSKAGLIRGERELSRQAQLTGLDLGDAIGEGLKYLSPLYRLFEGEAPLPKSPGQDKLPGGGGSQGAPEAFGLGSLGEFFDLLTDINFWIRLGEVIAGAVLIYLGLRTLTGVGVSDLPGYRVARAAARV